MGALRQELTRLADLSTGLLRQVEGLAQAQESYLRLLTLYARYGVISPEILVPAAKDAISRDIVRVLAQVSEANLPTLTSRLRDERGTASRRIVKARMEALAKVGAVEVRRSAGGHTFWRLSDEVVRKWSQLLGLVK